MIDEDICVAQSSRTVIYDFTFLKDIQVLPYTSMCEYEWALVSMRL